MAIGNSIVSMQRLCETSHARLACCAGGPTCNLGLQKTICFVEPGACEKRAWLLPLALVGSESQAPTTSSPRASHVHVCPHPCPHQCNATHLNKSTLDLLCLPSTLKSSLGPA
jgi:hypothetical protein